MAVIQGGLYLTHIEEPTAISWVAGLLLVLSAIGLITGFMTPAAAAIVVAGTGFITASWIRAAGSTFLDGVGAYLVIVDALALAAIGPGAYSLDAYLFGRREIVVPQRWPDA